MSHPQAAYLHYTQLYTAGAEKCSERIATLVINRPEMANAFSGELLVQLQILLKEVAADPSVRALLLQGKGKHFSAGADLHWMKASAQLDYTANILEAEKLVGMFEALAALKIPTIAVVKGAAFGGALGLIAACDYALAVESARFCLSEVKIGLLPAVILPYLGRKMEPGTLKRWMLTGKVFSATEALSCGLVQKVASDQAMESVLAQELEFLLAASPEAQQEAKTLFEKVSARQWQQGPDTASAIARVRASAMGQHGLAAFFAKSDPPWLVRPAVDAGLYFSENT